MGLFDTFLISANCPSCKDEISEWQTKELESLMIHRKQGEKFILMDKFEVNPAKIYEIEVHGVCKECDEFVNALVIIEDGLISKLVVDIH